MRTLKTSNTKWRLNRSNSWFIWQRANKVLTEPVSSNTQMCLVIKWGNSVRHSAQKSMHYNGADTILTYSGFNRALSLFRAMSLVDNTGWRLRLVFRSFLLEGAKLDLYSKRLCVSAGLFLSGKHTRTYPKWLPRERLCLWFVKLWALPQLCFRAVSIIRYHYVWYKNLEGGWTINKRSGYITVQINNRN